MTETQNQTDVISNRLTQTEIVSTSGTSKIYTPQYTSIYFSLLPDREKASSAKTKDPVGRILTSTDRHTPQLWIFHITIVTYHRWPITYQRYILRDWTKLSPEWSVEFLPRRWWRTGTFRGEIVGESKNQHWDRETDRKRDRDSKFSTLFHSRQFCRGEERECPSQFESGLYKLSKNKSTWSPL